MGHGVAEGEVGATGGSCGEKAACAAVRVAFAGRAAVGSLNSGTGGAAGLLRDTGVARAEEGRRAREEAAGATEAAERAAREDGGEAVEAASAHEEAAATGESSTGAGLGLPCASVAAAASLAAAFANAMARYFGAFCSAARRNRAVRSISSSCSRENSRRSGLSNSS